MVLVCSQRAPGVSAGPHSFELDVAGARRPAWMATIFWTGAYDDVGVVKESPFKFKTYELSFGEMMKKSFMAGRKVKAKRKRKRRPRGWRRRERGCS